MGDFFSPAELLRYLIISDLAITAIIAEKVFPQAAPQGTSEPYVTYYKISGENEHHMTAASGIARPRYQITAWSTSYAEAENIMDLIRRALDGRSGNFTTSGKTITGVVLMKDNDNESYFPPKDASGKGHHRLSHDYFIRHDETVPTF